MAHGLSSKQLHAEYSFLSYSRENIDPARYIKGRLERVHISVWMDESRLRAGEYFESAIDEAIKGARCVLILCSPSALSSAWVQRETALAFKYDKPIIPILLEGDLATAVASELQAFNYVDLRKKPFSEADFGHLVNGIYAHVKRLTRGNRRWRSSGPSRQVVLLPLGTTRNRADHVRL